MSFFTRFIAICFFIVIVIPANAQNSGDFRSRASGNWGDITTWQVYNGSSWVNATTGQIPGGTNESDANSVYIEAGHSVILEGDHSCKNLYLNTSTTVDTVRINTKDNVLNVWGKLVFYTGTAPGTTGTVASPITSSGRLGWISTGANGYIRFRGTVNRVVMAQGEVNSNNTNAGWNMDFAFNPGVVGEINDKIRATNITVSSGELFMNNASAELRVGTNNGAGDLTPNGNFIIKSGATVRGGAGIFKKTNIPSSLISIESGGTLAVSRSSYVLAAVTLQLNGTVVLEGGSISFPVDGGRTGAAKVNTFTNITLQGSGGKVLQNDITVNGKLKLSETASVSGTNIISYGPSGQLEYAGSVFQQTWIEFPATNGPTDLTINNPNGVSLSGNRTVNGQLTLSNGLLYLNDFVLTLGPSSPAIAGTLSSSSMIVPTKAGELRKIFSTPGSFFYPVGDTTGTDDYSNAQITVNSASNLGSTTYAGIRVVDADHPADKNIAAHNISRYWGVSSNMTNINYDGIFQYFIEDVNGTETSISSYIYNNESPLATGTLISSINSVLHRISISNQTAVGFITGSNLCRISNNTVTAPATVNFCETGNPGTFNASSATVTSGTPAYQWQQKVNGNWTDIITNGQSKNYSESATLTPGTYIYRRGVTDNAYCSSSEKLYSNEITISVSNPISNNSIGNDQVVGTGGDPAIVSPTSSIAGGNGTYTYQWQSSNSTGGPYGNINGETNASYDPASGILQTTFIVRVAYSGACTSTSNEIALTTCDVSNNSITSPSTTEYCNSATLSALDGAACTVSNGTISYQWQKSINGGSWSDISVNGQNEDYTEPASLSPGVYAYRRNASCGISSNDASSSITITVLLQITGNTIGNDQTITPGGDPSILTSTGTLSGGNGSYTYVWKSSTTSGSGYADIQGETNSSYDAAPGLSETTYLVRVVSSGSCSSTSNQVTLTVGPDAVYSPVVPGVSIYPNPVAGELNFDLDLTTGKEVFIHLTSSKGEVLYNNSLSANSLSTVDLSGYPSGIYYAQVLIDGKTITTYKIIKE